MVLNNQHSLMLALNNQKEEVFMISNELFPQFYSNI